MKTSEQPSVGPDEASRALTRRLADLAKSDSPRFADVVRAADTAMARGVPRDEAYWAALVAG